MVMFSFYRPPCNENLEVCFEDLTFLEKPTSPLNTSLSWGTSMLMLQIEGLYLIS